MKLDEFIKEILKEAILSQSNEASMEGHNVFKKSAKEMIVDELKGTGNFIRIKGGNDFKIIFSNRILDLIKTNYEENLCRWILKRF